MQRVPRAGQKPPVPSPAPISRSGSRAASSYAGVAWPWCMLSMAKRRGAEDRRPLAAARRHVQAHHLDGLRPGEVYTNPRTSKSYSPQQE